MVFRVGRCYVEMKVMSGNSKITLLLYFTFLSPSHYSPLVQPLLTPSDIPVVTSSVLRTGPEQVALASPPNVEPSRVVALAEVASHSLMGKGGEVLRGVGSHKGSGEVGGSKTEGDPSRGTASRPWTSNPTGLWWNRSSSQLFRRLLSLCQSQRNCMHSPFLHIGDAHAYATLFSVMLQAVWNTTTNHTAHWHPRMRSH